MNDKSDDSTLGTGSGRFTTEHETLTERRCADDWLPRPSRWGVAVRWFSTASPLSTPFSIPPCRATRRQALSFHPFPNSLFLFLLSSCQLSHRPSSVFLHPFASVFHPHSSSCSSRCRLLTVLFRHFFVTWHFFQRPLSIFLPFAFVNCVR